MKKEINQGLIVLGGIIYLIQYGELTFSNSNYITQNQLSSLTIFYILLGFIFLMIGANLIPEKCDNFTTTQIVFNILAIISTGLLIFLFYVEWKPLYIRLLAGTMMLIIITVCGFFVADYNGIMCNN